MSDELIEHYHEHGKPQEQSCSYGKNPDGSVRIQSAGRADCTTDFSDLAFFVEPNEKPKLKTTWRKK